MTELQLQELRNAKRMAHTAASGMFYPEEVKHAISKAKSVGEVERIMVNARHKYL